MKKSFPFFIFLTLLLGSCSLDISIGTSNKGSTSSSNNTPTTSLPNSSSNTVTPTTSAGTTSTGGTITSATPSIHNGAQVLKNNGYTNTLRDSNEQIGWNTLNSTGNQKVLVVPVHFKKETNWSTKMLSDLELVFFGKSKYTAWESVSSYFNKSSYGNLNLTGEVFDTVLEVDMTASSYNSNYINWYNNGGSVSYDPGKYIGGLFYNSLNSNDMKKLQEYDQDKDGYIDAIIFCYSNAFSNDGSGAYWAWCSSADNKANLQGPTVNNYMWLSYEFIHEGYGNNAIDAHTFIHEMGHILGLDDYYCYDSYEEGYGGNYPWNCAGELDMQSYNVGDHNIYSKFSLGWLEPKWIKESGEVKLRPSNQYGDAILLKDSWNGTIFDEYILIEFYTPEGLNEKDATSQYSGRDKMYSQSGLRIYHVDARLANLTYNSRTGLVFKNYAVTAENIVSVFKSNNYGYIPASNSVQRSYLSSNQEKDRLLHLIDAGGNNTIAKGLSNRDNYGGTYANRNSTIWQEGKTFTATSAFFMNGNNTFNDGSKVGYSVTVGAIENGEITINIQKL